MQRYLLGCNVGTGCDILSSLSMDNNVVFPALSKPKNTSLPDFLYRPKTNNQNITFGNEKGLMFLVENANRQTKIQLSQIVKSLKKLEFATNISKLQLYRFSR